MKLLKLGLYWVLQKIVTNMFRVLTCFGLPLLKIFKCVISFDQLQQGNCVHCLGPINKKSNISDSHSLVIYGEMWTNVEIVVIFLIKKKEGFSRLLKVEGARTYTLKIVHKYIGLP